MKGKCSPITFMIIVALKDSEQGVMKVSSNNYVITHSEVKKKY